MATGVRLALQVRSVWCIIKYLRPWRNWQTLRTKDPVSQDVEVQALSAAPNQNLRKSFRGGIDF